MRGSRALLRSKFSLSRASPPVLTVLLGRPRLLGGRHRGAAHGGASQLLPRFPDRDDRILKPTLELAHHPVPINLGTAAYLAGVSLRPILGLGRPPLRAPVQLRIQNPGLGPLVRFLDYPARLLLGGGHNRGALPTDRLGLRQLLRQNPAKLIQHREQVGPVNHGPSLAHRYPGGVLYGRPQFVQHSTDVLHILLMPTNPSTALE